MINNEMINTLLLYHAPENRDLINHQTNILLEVIATNRKKYDSSIDYRNAIDEILKLVLQGKFVGGK